MKNWLLHHGFKFLFLLTFVGLGFFILPDFSWAQELVIPNKEVISPSIVTDKTFGETVLTIVNYLTGILGFLATLVFIYAGVLWVLNGGSEEMITKAKKIMIYAGLGIIVVILSYTIVTFITSSAGGETRVTGSGAKCQFDFDCAENEWCVLDRQSKTYKCTDNPQVLFDKECFTNAQCAPGKVCYQNTCVDSKQADNAQCLTSEQCNVSKGEVCWNNICQSSPRKPGTPLQCLGSFHCAAGEFCSNGRCQKGGDTRCSANTDCAAPKICDASGFCRNPNAGSDTRCTDNTDCAAGYVCNKSGGRCEFQGSGGAEGAGITGSPAIAASEENLGKMDGALSGLASALEGLSDEVNRLPEGAKKEINLALGQGSLNDKIGRLEDLLKKTDEPAMVRVLERLIAAMGYLTILRDEMDDLRAVMPESGETIKGWEEASTLLNELIDSPTSSTKLRRFETKYRNLRDMIRRFPVVQSRIKAFPAQGNIPFTVTLDGLDSVDPTGGTISDYKWTFLDNQGREVSLGNSAVVVHEFTEPNTYAIRLHVSTSQRDKEGYKTAADGVSTVRIKANPPSSKVRFRINGAEVDDVHRVTIKEAQAGLTFDPTGSVPALGRVIQKYEWAFGDTAVEDRTTPTTVVHTYQKPGEYFVKLVVTDNQGVKDQRITKLIVKSLAADLSINPPEGNVNTEFTFRGVTSRSDDGSIRHYQWTIEDPEGRALRESEEDHFTYRFERPGSYRIQLLVTDITGASDNIVKTLKVVSRTPVASFTYEIPEGNHPERVAFNAINSYDPDQGDIITYSWDFDGDGQFEIVAGKEPEVTHVYKKAGDYKVRLQVEDNFGQRHLIEKVVTIGSTLSADIELLHRAVQVGQEVEFKVKSGTAISYLWEFGDGETESTDEKIVKHVYKRTGKYIVKLHFFDDKDNENVATASLLVGAGDRPVATIDYAINGRQEKLTDNACGEGKSGLILTRADTLLLKGENSINTDGTSRLLTYHWQFADGAQDDRKEFTHRFTEISSACSSVSLIVRDQLSGKESEKEELLIKIQNKLPEITDFVIEVDPAKGNVTPLNVHLRVSNPKDHDGTIKRYRWWTFVESRETEQLGLHSTTVPRTEMVATAQGEPGLKNNMFFVVEITDNDGGVYTSLDRFKEVSSLEIENGPNLSPVTEFTMDKTTITAGDSVTFISKSYDPQGENFPPSAFQWDFDGDGAFDDTKSGPTVNRQYNTPGEYQVRLKVTYRGLSTTVSKTIFVEPAQTLPQAAFTYTASGNTVNFDGNASRFDPDLKDLTLRYEWDFDVTQDADGNGAKDDDIESTEVKPIFSYPASGVYRVRLKVKDSLGAEGVVVREIDLNLSAEERENLTLRSLKVRSPDQPLTALDVVATPAFLKKGSAADLEVSILNADNSVYGGQVFFEIVEGSGEISPNPVDVKNGKGLAVFTATEIGLVKIRVRATGTVYGDITEDIILQVSP